MDAFIIEIKRWMRTTGGGALDFFVRVLLAILVYFLVYKVLNRLLRLLERSLVHHQVEATIRHFISQLIRYSVLILTIITIIVQLKLVEASAIAALIASAGVGISLAMQGVLSNFAGGILLLLLHPFREGDFIVMNNSDIEGTVVKIEIYYTTIRSLWGDLIVIPNSELTNHAVTNKNSDHTRTLVTQVNISYRQDIQQATLVLREILSQESRLIQGKSRVGVSTLGESGVELTLRCYVPAERYYEVLWDLNEKIRIRFAEEGIEIPYHQLDVHIRKDV